MLVKVVDFLEEYAICNYTDEDGYNAYGYLHTLEIDDMKLPVQEKVKIGDEIDAEIMYVCRGDTMLTVNSCNEKTFEERLNGLNKFDSVVCCIVKETKNGGIANINGVPGYIPGNLNIGTQILASISKILTDKHMLLLNLESVFY